MFMVLLALSICSWRATADNLTLCGNADRRRDQIETEPLIGVLINTLAYVYGCPTPNSRPIDRECRETALSLTRISTCHLKAGRASTRGSLEHNAIFQIMFALQNGQTFQPDLPA